MLSLIQIIIFIGSTTFWLLVSPFITFRYQKKLNRNMIVPKSPWSAVFFSLFLGIIFITSHVLILYKEYRLSIEDKSLSVPAPQIETKKEWFQGEKIFNVAKNKWEYPMDEKPINYYPIEKHNLPTKKEDGSWTIWDPNRPTWVKGEHKIERTYTFFGFNGLDQCQYKDKVPTDLPPFIKEPFNNWRYTGKMKPYDDSFTGRDKNYFEFEFRIDVLSSRDSKFHPNGFVKQDNTIEMDYEGPKYLLEDDKDFYINTVECPLQEKKKFETKCQNYYLHFNPVKQYITLYTEKMNPKEN